MPDREEFEILGVSRPHFILGLGLLAGFIAGVFFTNSLGLLVHMII